MVVSGTNVNESITSLKNGYIVSLLGNGWRPRSCSLRIIDDQANEIFIRGLDNLEGLKERLEEFINEERSGKYD